MKISNLKFNELQIVESGKDYGPMSFHEKYYDGNKSEKYRKEQFMVNRMNLGARYGFCGRNMFVVKSNPSSGDYLEITKRVVEDSFSGFPYTEATSDILIISSDVPDVVIGGLHREMPILLAYDQYERVLGAISCPVVTTNQDTPSMLVDAMVRHGSRKDNLFFYIGRSTEDIIIDDDQTIETLDDFLDLDQNGIYHLNPKSVIRQRLIERGIHNIETSPVNTLFDYDSYYDPEEGYNFTGGFIMSENNCKRYRLER